MPRAKELTVKIEDKPGALGKCFLALGDAGVNILAFQSFVEEGESEARLLADDMARAKSMLGSQRMIFEETEVVTVKLKNRPGALGRAAARLGENHVNIDYSYCGPAEDPAHVVLVFGVDNLNKGAAALDALAAEDARQ
jgi:hypothetical protein